MSDQVFVPREFAIKAVEFMDKCAGEGICFDLNTPEELDPENILYDWLGKSDSLPIWIPKRIREDWK